MFNWEILDSIGFALFCALVLIVFAAVLLFFFLVLAGSTVWAYLLLVGAIASGIGAYVFVWLVLELFKEF